MLQVRVFTAIAFVFGLLASASITNAFDSRVDVRDRVLEISTDERHDIVAVQINPDDPEEVSIYISQNEVPLNLFDYNSPEELDDASDDYRYEERDLDRFDRIEIRTLAGDDVVFIEFTLNIPCLIVGGDGNDMLSGGLAGDDIYGDSDDANSYASGEDYIYGYGGEDSLYGGPESDHMFGGLSGDTMFGDDGDDHMYGQAGEDVMFGGDDSDTMRGGTDDDEMFGEDGEDFLYGNDGRDELDGGDHDDFLDGSFDGEIDVMYGGAGGDEFVYRYFEMRTGTSILWRPVRQQRIRWVRGFPIFYWVTIYVPQTVYFTYPFNLEVEQVEDYNQNEGDVMTSVAQ